jgi:hypothetical protein
MYYSLSMNVDFAELRRRMAERSDSELTEITANARGEYTFEALDAARLELAIRPPRTEAEESETISPSFPYLKPLGIRIAFWIACVFAIGASVSMLITSLMAITNATSRPDRLGLIQQAITALLSWWIVVAIKREHVYTRTLLISVLAASVVNDVLMAAVTRQWSEIVTQTSYPLAALAYLIVSPDVAAYYGRIGDGNDEEPQVSSAG